jgi:hypothetical protein
LTAFFAAVMGFATILVQRVISGSDLGLRPGRWRESRNRMVNQKGTGFGAYPMWTRMR